MPSSVSVNVFAVPVTPLALIPTLTVPFTVAPAAGLVIAAASAPLVTVTTRIGGLGSVAPWLSVTVSET